MSLEQLHFWNRLLFLRTYTFWKELVCLLYRSLSPSLTFVYCKGPYLAEEFFHNHCPCFDIAIAQLGAISRRRNNSVEIVAVAERYLIVTHVKNEESKK